MELELPGRSSKLVANFRYSIKEDVTEDQYPSISSIDYDLFDSSCDSTMVGVSFLANAGAIQCWVGQQTQPLTTE